MSNRRAFILFFILFGLLAAAFVFYPKKQQPPIWDSPPINEPTPTVKVMIPPVHYEEYQDGKG